MTGEEWFELAAAVAGVSMGLAAILLLAIVAILGTWRLSRSAAEAQQATMRASITIEEVGRAISASAAQTQTVDWRPELERLLLQQRQLQDTMRTLIESGGTQDVASPALAKLEESIERLDTTVGQMAISLTNLIQLLERRQALK